jgi:hypothetical protein
MYSRHILFRLVTSTIRSRCFASTLVLAEQLNTPVNIFLKFIFRLTAAAQLKQGVDCIIFGT